MNMLETTGQLLEKNAGLIDKDLLRAQLAKCPLRDGGRV